MSDDHMSLLLFQKKTGAKFAMSHFDGSAPAQTALQGGHVSMLVDNMGGVASGYKSGTIRVLGIASDQRSPLMPDVPTLKEQGIDLSTAVARGWAAPAGTSPEIIKILEAAMKKVDGLSEYKDKMTAAALPTRFMGADEYAKYLQAEEQRVAELLKEVN